MYAGVEKEKRCWKDTIYFKNLPSQNKQTHCLNNGEPCSLIKKKSIIRIRNINKK